jgi:hypothetical protein
MAVAPMVNLSPPRCGRVPCTRRGRPTPRCVGGGDRQCRARVLLEPSANSLLSASFVNRPHTAGRVDGRVLTAAELHRNRPTAQLLVSDGTSHCRLVMHDTSAFLLVPESTSLRGANVLADGALPLCPSSWLLQQGRQSGYCNLVMGTGLVRSAGAWRRLV